MWKKCLKWSLITIFTGTCIIAAGAWWVIHYYPYWNILPKPLTAQEAKETAFFAVKNYCNNASNRLKPCDYELFHLQPQTPHPEWSWQYYVFRSKRHKPIAIEVNFETGEYNYRNPHSIPYFDPGAGWNTDKFYDPFKIKRTGVREK